MGMGVSNAEEESTLRNVGELLGNIGFEAL
jgi:hypothetical protein